MVYVDNLNYVHAVRSAESGVTVCRIKLDDSAEVRYNIKHVVGMIPCGDCKDGLLSGESPAKMTVLNGRIHVLPPIDPEI